MITVCSQIHTKHINTVCGQNVELLNVKLISTYIDHQNSHFLKTLPHWLQLNEITNQW